MSNIFIVFTQQFSNLLLNLGLKRLASIDDFFDNASVAVVLLLPDCLDLVLNLGVDRSHAFLVDVSQSFDHVLGCGI